MSSPKVYPQRPLRAEDLQPGGQTTPQGKTISRLHLEQLARRHGVDHTQSRDAMAAQIRAALRTKGPPEEERLLELLSHGSARTRAQGRELLASLGLPVEVGERIQREAAGARISAGLEWVGGRWLGKGELLALASLDVIEYARAAIAMGLWQAWKEIHLVEVPGEDLLEVGYAELRTRERPDGGELLFPHFVARWDGEQVVLPASKTSWIPCAERAVQAMETWATGAEKR